MAESDLAAILLSLAEQDALAYRKLAGDPEIGDALVGFHAQQATEKAIKAVLARNRVAFRRTHDIAELLDLMTDASLDLPPHAEHLDELNPFAVEMRYGLVQPGKLDRAATQALLDVVIAWALAKLSRP